MNDRRQPFDVATALAALPGGDEARAHAQTRLDALQQGLSAHAFPLRSDSRLAFLWASEQLHCTWDAREVCHEIMSVQFICAQTSYTELLSPFLRALAERMKTHHGLRSWGETWRIVREYGPDLLKVVALLESNVQIPNFQPIEAPLHPVKGGAEATDGGAGAPEG